MIYSVPDLESERKMWVLHKHFTCSNQYLFRLAEFREVFQGFYHQGLIWLWSIFALKLLMVHKGNRVTSTYVLNSEKCNSERCHRNFQHKVELCNRILPLHKVRKFGRHIFNMYGQAKLQTLITKCEWEVRNSHLWKSPWYLQRSNQYMPFIYAPCPSCLCISGCVPQRMKCKYNLKWILFPNKQWQRVGFSLWTPSDWGGSADTGDHRPQGSDLVFEGE